MSKHNSKLLIRITVLGDKGTGKTTFIKSYLGDDVNNVEISGAAYTLDTVVCQTNVTQQILDSTGKQTAVTAWAHGVVVLYSVNDKNSFKLAEECISNIKEVTMKDAVIILVANKTDIESRVVSYEDGEKLAAKYNCGYSELSALHEGSKITTILYELSQQILVRRGIKVTSSTKKKHPQFFRRMVNAVTKGKSLPVVKEGVTETSI